MATTKTITLYEFDELSDTAKDRAREWFRGCKNANDYDGVRDDVVAVLELLGVTLKTHAVRLMNGTTRYEPNVWWQVGYMQSDGACFEGTYAYRRGAHRLVREHAPEDARLHAIADALLNVQRKYRYQVTATICSGHQSFFPDVDVSGPGGESSYESAFRGEVAECVRDLCAWMYQQFRQEDEYQSADEQVDENIRANEYTFTVDGERENP